MHGVKAKVYWNFHRKCFSVQVRGRVVAHCTSLALLHAHFQVSAAGRARVLREGRKNVHAFIIGYLARYEAMPSTRSITLASYNPRKHETFVTLANTPLHNAEWVVCHVNENRTPTVTAVNYNEYV